MAANIHHLIAAINPELFCQPWLERQGQRVNLIAEVKRLAEKQGYLAAARAAQPRESEVFDFEKPENQNPFSLGAVKQPVEQHHLVYDDLDESLAATYFWLLDALPTVCPRLRAIEKLVDNCGAAPGSSHFADLHRQFIQTQDKAVQMLEQARRCIESIRRDLAELHDLEEGLRLARQNEPAIEPGLPARIETVRTRVSGQLALAKLHARWLKPYLKSAFQLEPRTQGHPALVSGFNTALLEVVWLVEAQYDPREDVSQGHLPKGIVRLKHRDYFSTLVVELRFRGIPERLKQGGYVYRGRSEFTLTSYALNEDELRALKAGVEQDDLGDLFKATVGLTDESVAQLQRELEKLESVESMTGQGSKANSPADEDVNPFSALLSLLRWDDNDAAKGEAGQVVRPDSEIEKVLRNQALFQARRSCRLLYDRFKKRLNMATEPDTPDLP